MSARRQQPRERSGAATHFEARRSSGVQAAGDVATVVVGVGLLSFVCVSCVGVIFGAFGVASVIAAFLSPWTLVGTPIVGYGLWRWQRRRLECRIDTIRQTADSG